MDIDGFGTCVVDVGPGGQNSEITDATYGRRCGRRTSQQVRKEAEKTGRGADTTQQIQEAGTARPPQRGFARALRDAGFDQNAAEPLIIGIGENFVVVARDYD